MKGIPAESVDFVLDPPYGTTSCRWGSVIDLSSMWAELRRIVKPDSAIVFTACNPFTSVLIMSNLKMFRYTLVWEKGEETGHLNARKMPMRAHEDIAFFTQSCQLTILRKQRVMKERFLLSIIEKVSESQTVMVIIVKLLAMILLKDIREVF